MTRRGAPACAPLVALASCSNCNSFCDALCQRIVGKGIPGYVNRMAQLGARGGLVGNGSYSLTCSADAG